METSNTADSTQEVKIPKAYTRFGWDHKVDYEKAKRELLSEIKRLRETANVKKRGLEISLKFAYTVTLLIQVRNAARVGEAVEALQVWCNKRVKELQVKTEKREDQEIRLIVIPKELTDDDWLIARSVIDKVKKKNVGMYCLRRFGFNTHSLRYARITWMSKHGYQAQVIAKTTKHRNLQFIMDYTQQVEADDLHRQLE